MQWHPVGYVLKDTMQSDTCDGGLHFSGETTPGRARFAVESMGKRLATVTETLTDGRMFGIYLRPNAFVSKKGAPKMPGWYHIDRAKGHLYRVSRSTAMALDWKERLFVQESATSKYKPPEGFTVADDEMLVLSLDSLGPRHHDCDNYFKLSYPPSQTFRCVAACFDLDYKASEDVKELLRIGNVKLVEDDSQYIQIRNPSGEYINMDVKPGSTVEVRRR